MKTEVTLKELYLTRTPFAIVQSEEFGGTIYSVVFRNQGIKTFEIEKDEINYFFTIQSKAKKIDFGYEGSVFEFFDFKNKLSVVTRHQFIEGLKRGVR
jgi:hypothetical protein